MTTQALERAARAGADAACKPSSYVSDDKDLSDITVDGQVDFYAIARAVLMAVRDERVNVSGIKPEVDIARSSRETELVLDYAQQGYTTTIRAILGEGEGG